MGNLDPSIDLNIQNGRENQSAHRKTHRSTFKARNFDCAADTTATHITSHLLLIIAERYYYSGVSPTSDVIGRPLSNLLPRAPTSQCRDLVWGGCSLLSAPFRDLQD